MVHLLYHKSASLVNTFTVLLQFRNVVFTIKNPYIMAVFPAKSGISHKAQSTHWGVS